MNKQLQDLIDRYLYSTEEIKWKDINNIEFTRYENLEHSEDKEHIKTLLNKLVVLKLNGGLGTSMGCSKPKGFLEIKDGKTFFDFTIDQVKFINNKYNVDIPICLMNSFNTDDITKEFIKKYKSDVQILTFEQTKLPRLRRSNLKPIYNQPYNKDNKNFFYPPGHGDIYRSLLNSGVLDKLLDLGKEYIFISNIDNLGATISPNILNHIIKLNKEFLIEVTDKTKTDVKGGTIIDYNNNLHLLEIAQVPDEHVNEFKYGDKFNVFNTNNLWIKLSAIKDRVNSINSPIIFNEKTLNGEDIVQLETAMGAAVNVFDSECINVPRSRFVPVKKTNDLLIIKSNFCNVQEDYSLKLLNLPPIINLDPLYYKNIDDFNRRFQFSIPDLSELTQLNIEGDVVFGDNCKISKKVVINNKKECSIFLKNTTLENVETTYFS